MISRLNISDLIPCSWLVRLANPAEEDRDKVFALKVLRKVEGKDSRYENQSSFNN